MLRDVSSAAASPVSLPGPAAVDGIAAVAAGEWNDVLSPGQGPIRHGYIAAWEHAELRGLRSRPLVARASDGDEILAAAPAYFYELDMAATQNPLVVAALERIRRLAPRLLFEPVFEVGTPTPLVPPFARRPSIDAGAAATALARAAVAEAARGGAPMVLVQNFESTTGVAADALRAAGFLPVPIPPTVVVELPFASFDGYLGAMRAPYRRRARRVLEQSSGLRVEHVRDFAGLAPELARLWRLVFDRADELKREILPEPFFRRAADADGLSVLLLRRDDDSIASYALLLDDDPCLHFLYCGFEARAREEAAYFRLLYEIVRTGITGRFAHVNLGLTTLAPKLDIGGVPVPLYAWLYHANPVLRRLFARLAAGPFAPPRAEPRNVFKS